MVLKANDRRTSCPCHDEFRGPRSDYVRQQMCLEPFFFDDISRLTFVHGSNRLVTIVVFLGSPAERKEVPDKWKICCVQGERTATAGSDVVQSGRPIFDGFFQHLWPNIGNNTANVVFQMVKRLWLIRLDQ
ncbi:hypothetical protein TNCV_4203811 [Trichonephila clavipes]|nr:hypothetical protein TNCV_4203811 [Trichonephila clavipes]